MSRATGRPNGRPNAPAACTRCSGGRCPQCKTYARMFRLAIKRALAQPGMEVALKTIGLELESDRIVGGGLEADAATQALLKRLFNAVLNHRRAEAA